MNDDLLSGPEPGPEELRAIVSRATKRRWRTIGVAAVIALAAGGGIGYGVSNHSGGGQTVVAGSSSATTVHGVAPGIGSASVGIASPAARPNMARLFVRDANGVTVRGYLNSLTLPSSPAMCMRPSSLFEAEVSTQYAVGQDDGYSVSASTQPIKGAQAELLGVGEHDPMYVVVVNIGPGVAQVKMTFTSGGSDQMAPVGSWAALAAEFPLADLPPSGQVPQSVGTLEALGGSGQVLQTMAVHLGINPDTRPAANCGCPPIEAGNGATRSAAPAVVCAQPGTASSGGAAGRAG